MLDMEKTIDCSKKLHQWKASIYTKGSLIGESMG